MTLGEKLRAARLEAGLSQRQLCGDTITRNMLSQIENGTANPSMATLTVLAGRLGKPLGWFLGEAQTGNGAAMALARSCYDRQDAGATLEALEGYQGPDGDFDREYNLLSALARLDLARQALDDSRPGLAEKYLADVRPFLDGTYCREELERKRLLLLGRLGHRVGQALPSLDEELLLRATEAMKEGKQDRARQFLAAAETRSCQWQLLWGRCCVAEGRWQEAAQALHLAEDVYPGETAPLLEQAYREMGDYRRAYEYACKQKTS